MSRAIALAAALLLAGGARANAQLLSHLQPAGRVDVLASRITAVQAGAELTAAAGHSLRVSLVGGLGGSWGHGATGLSARAELLGRFLLDPDFAQRWSPYAGGGLGLRYDHIADRRGVLVLFVGGEGPNWNGIVPFIEAGYGGGGRFGIGFRKTRAAGR